MNTNKVYIYKVYDEIIDAINNTFNSVSDIYRFRILDITENSFYLMEYIRNRVPYDITYSEDYFSECYNRLLKYKTELVLIQKYMNDNESF